MVRKKKYHLKPIDSEDKIEKNNNLITNDENTTDFKHIWPSETFLNYCKSVKTDDLKHYLALQLKKKSKHLLHIGTSNAVLKTSREILDELFQLNQYIIRYTTTTRMVCNCDYDKLALILSHLLNFYFFLTLGKFY